jgi:hypothetical protein
MTILDEVQYYQTATINAIPQIVSVYCSNKIVNSMFMTATTPNTVTTATLQFPQVVIVGLANNIIYNFQQAWYTGG